MAFILGQPMKILVIQQKHIGDVLTATVLLEALADRYPEAELHYLVNAHTAAVVEHNPFIDELILFTPAEKEWKMFRALLRRIHRQQYDVVIDAYGKWSSVIMTWCSRAPLRISYYKWYTWFFFSHTTPRLKQPEQGERLSIENRLKLLTPLSIPFHPYRPKLYLSAAEKAAGPSHLAAAGINPGQPLFMIGLLGSSAEKSYPAPYMTALLQHLCRQVPGLQLLFNYAPDQQAAANRIYTACDAQTRDHFFPEVYGGSLREFIGLARCCHAFIGNEGGAANMAKALDVPVFANFSPQIDKQGWFNPSEQPLHRAVHLSDYTSWNTQKRKAARKNPQAFYKQLLPEKIFPELDRFLGALKRP